MKKFLSLAPINFLLVAMSASAQSATAYRANCGDVWTRRMDRITNLEELQNAIKRYENIIQNTINLPQNVLNEMKGNCGELAKLTQNLKLQKGVNMAMGQVFDQIYPGLDIIKGLANGDAAKPIAEVWNEWSKEVERAAQATFQVTGSQLKGLAENSDELDQHTSRLLSIPEGQMQAIQSGNSLAANQVEELRKLRLLMATNIQATTRMAMKNEKRGQLSKEQLDHVMDTTKIKEQYQGYY